MASFTDTQPPKFNPYIQQQPVEAMTQVGMQKQKAYDEGVQKIQTQIDNIAGLDVVRDVDKAYLQSKVNELGNKLRTVAAGDFSNFQFVNSVGGMTKQIAQDEYVQNAVHSAAKYRKELGYLEKDVAEGKENPANTAHFYKNASKWINSGDLKQSFNAKYVTPKDVWGKIKDIAKEVGVDEQTIQQLYQTDENGNYLLDANKKPIWNKIMVEKTLKGKDAGKILKAFEMGLTPADYQQLAISGEYQNAGLDADQLKARVVAEADEQIEFNDNKILNLRTALLQENQKNVKDPNVIKNLNDQIEYFEDKNDKINKSRERNLQTVDTNPDAVRGSLYTNDYMYTMSRSLSSQDVSTKYSVSPMFEITMKENEFNRQVQRDKIADYHWSVERQEAREKAQGEREDKALELFMKYGVKTPGLKLPPGFTGGGDRLTEAIPEIKKEEVKAAVEDKYSGDVENLNSKNYELTLNYFKEINKDKRLPGEKDDAFDKRMRQAIDYYARATKDKKTGRVVKKAEEAADFKSGAVNTFTARFAAKQLEAWKQDPNNAPQEFRKLLDAQNKLSKSVENQRKRIQSVKAEAMAEGKAQGLSTLTDQEIKKNIQETSVYIDPKRMGGPLAGKTLRLSKQDVTDFASLHPEVYNFFGSWTVDSAQEQRRDLARKRLTLKYGKNLENLDDYLHDARYTKGEFGEGSKYYGRINPNIKKAGDFMNSSDYTKLSKIENELYIKKGVIKQPTSVALYRGEEKPEDFTSRVFSVVDKYNLDGKVLASKGIDMAEFQEAILTNDKKAVKVIHYPGVGTGHDKYAMRITAGKNKTVELDIDPDDYRILTRMDAPRNVALPEVVEKLNFDGTTNTSGHPKGAWWSSSDFKKFNSKKYSVTGDLVKDKEDPTAVHMRLYVYDKARPHDEPRTLTFPQEIKLFGEDGTYNSYLDYLPTEVTESMVEQISKHR